MYQGGALTIGFSCETSEDDVAGELRVAIFISLASRNVGEAVTRCLERLLMLEALVFR